MNTVSSAIDSGIRPVQGENSRRRPVPLSGKTIAAAEAGFAALNRALKQRAEGQR